MAPHDHKRKAVIAKLVNKSASRRFGSLEILLELLRNLGAVFLPPPAVGPANEEVLEQLKVMLEGAIRNSIAAEK